MRIVILMMFCGLILSCATAPEPHLTAATASPHFSHPLRSGGMNVTPALPQAAAAL